MRKRIVIQQRTFTKQYPKGKRWKWGSPYWDYLYERAGKGTDQGNEGTVELREPAQANPDVISDENSLHKTLWAPAQGNDQTEKFKTTNWQKVLTKQQYKVLCKTFEFIKKGKIKRLNQDVGEALGMSRQGVANHIKLIEKKMIKILGDSCKIDINPILNGQ